MDNHFAGMEASNAGHNATADAVLEQVQSRMTDGALAELVKQGVIDATADKAKAASIVANAFKVMRIASPLLGL
jgi:hypothetical protein